jgi:hypothetical protein
VFGVELGRVRVHRDITRTPGPVAWTQGEDIHVAPSAYRPDEPSGRRVLGHEIAHFIQQRAGRVADSVDRWALEVEAEEAAERYARGLPVRIPGGSGSPRAVRTGAVQCYTVVPPAGRAAAGVTVGASTWSSPTGGNDAFAGQNNVNAVAVSAPADPPVSFLNAAGKLNLVSVDPTGVILRVSAGGRMAIEDCDLTVRQPKVFYATAAVIAESNAWRAATGECAVLVPDPALGAQTITINGQVLLRVTLDAWGRRQFGAVGPQNCDNVLGAALGAGMVEPRLDADLGALPLFLPESEIARFLVTPAPPAVGGAAAAQADTVRVIAAAYGTAQRNGTFRVIAGQPADRHFGVNRYAAPEVGEGFAICSFQAVPAGQTLAGAQLSTDHNRVGDPVLERSSFWSAHYAGVVARDGGDVITLENYARHTEVADPNLRDRVGYYFQMYDTAPGAAAGHTFHGAWTSAPLRAVNPAIAADANALPGETHRPVPNGARTFTNPLTVRAAVTGRGHHAVATGRYKDLTDDHLQSFFATAANPAAPLDQYKAVLKGLTYANRLADRNKPVSLDLIDPWIKALRVANDPTRGTVARNLIAIAYTLALFEGLPTR